MSPDQAVGESVHAPVDAAVDDIEDVRGLFDGVPDQASADRLGIQVAEHENIGCAEPEDSPEGSLLARRHHDHQLGPVHLSGPEPLRPVTREVVVVGPGGSDRVGRRRSAGFDEPRRRDADALPEGGRKPVVEHGGSVGAATDVPVAHERHGAGWPPLDPQHGSPASPGMKPAIRRIFQPPGEVSQVAHVRTEGHR